MPQLFALGVLGVPGPGPVRPEVPGLRLVRHPEVEQPGQLGPVRRVGDPQQRLDPAVQIAVHHVGAADPHLRIAVVAEHEDPRVLQEPPQDAAHPDVLAQPRHAGPDRADAAHPHVHRHPGLRGPVQRVDHGLVDDRVDLELHVRRTPGPVVGDLVVDPPHQTVPQPPRRGQQPAVGLAARIAREPVEEVREVRADLRVRGQQTEVLVEPGGLRVVVAGADVRVTAQGVTLLPDHQRQLAVRLQPDQAVDHVAAGLLQLAGPLDVGLLVEARLDLDQDQHLLAGLRRVDQRVDDRRVPGGPVQRLLDRQHVRVGGGLLQEGLHRGGEAVERVVQQHVPLAHRGEDVRLRGRLDIGQAARGARHELRVVQLRPVQPGDAEQPGQVQRAGQREDLRLGDVQLPHQQVQDVGVDRLLDLQPHRRAEAPPHQLLLQGLEDVLGVVLLHLQVLVASDPEGVVGEHLHPREELLQMRPHDVLQRHVPLRGGLQEARERLRHLHPGEVLVPGHRVAHDDGQVEGEPRYVGEGVRRVHRQRGEDREDLLPEQRVQPRLLLLGQLRPADHLDALGREVRQHLLLERGGMAGHQLARPGPDEVQHLARLEAGGTALGHAGGDPALEAGHPDHEELVEVAREDRQELGALQQRDPRVLGQFQDPLVEREPAALTVEEAALGQFLGVLLVGDGRLRRYPQGAGHPRGWGGRGRDGAGDAHGLQLLQQDGVRTRNALRAVALARRPRPPTRRGRHSTGHVLTDAARARHYGLHPVIFAALIESTVNTAWPGGKLRRSVPRHRVHNRCRGLVLSARRRRGALFRPSLSVTRKGSAERPRPARPRRGTSGRFRGR